LGKYFQKPFFSLMGFMELEKRLNLGKCPLTNLGPLHKDKNSSGTL
jgi:hypothetical protein